MLPLERQKKIIELLKFKKVMKIKELLTELDISIDTLRRDLNILTKQGKIEKIYGGVKLAESPLAESSMDKRLISHIEEKNSIAQTCSEYIQDGDCIYLDSGSTTLQIAKYIKNKRKLTVITNSVPVVLELMNSNLDLIMIGGKVRKEEQSVVTYDYLFNFNQLNIQKAFICASGITFEKGISDYHIEEAITRKNIISLSSEIYVAADSTKFGKDVTVGITPLEKVDYIVTDQHIHETFITAFKDTSTKLIIANS
ncbi:transcriptional regulator [Virgibacillus soli]|uniref:DeoR/GlpR family DNA-binding transcription regulator n=1 Tax=Lederbergia galactosidilytica TaxID=217031 RepID=UPI0007139BB8|nr:DeoR/GlpR family DNA-binding transcription regulator [Lederbergia galactosidilytica]KRG16339.1 transcriptional regulator [Virgibacillus soli]